jgi:hypothetical protein
MLRHTAQDAAVSCESLWVAGKYNAPQLLHFGERKTPYAATTTPSNVCPLPGCGPTNLAQTLPSPDVAGRRRARKKSGARPCLCLVRRYCFAVAACSPDPPEDAGNNNT